MEPKIRIVTSQKLISVVVGTTATEALRLMDEKRIRHLAIVNEHQEVVGVISSHLLSNLKNPELMPVEFFINKPASFVDQNSPLRSSILKMLSEKISSLLITDENGEAVGIVTTDDLLWYLAHKIEEENSNSISFSSFFNLQTIGEASRQLALAGI